MIGYLYVWKADNKQPFTIAQKIVTGMPYRHNSWGVGDLYGNGTQWQLEAFLCVTTTPIEAKDCRVFRINASDQVLHDLTAALAERYSGRVYGFLSLLNYLGRAVVSLFGGDGRKFCPIRFGDVCSDWYGEYPATAVTDPKGPEKGTTRILRGGSWRGEGPEFLRSALRAWHAPDYRRDDVGFRVVMEAGN